MPSCLLPGQPIMTCYGERAVEDILPGDLVMTHRGRWRPVLRAWTACYLGDAVDVRLRGAHLDPVRATTDHLFWLGGAFVAASALRIGSPMASLLLAAPPTPAKESQPYLAQVARQRHGSGRWRTILVTPWATYLQQDDTSPFGPQDASRLEPLIGLFRVCEAGLVRRRPGGRALAADGRPPGPEDTMNRFLLVEKASPKGVGRGEAPPLMETPGWSTRTRQALPVRRNADAIVFGEAPPAPKGFATVPPRPVMRRVLSIGRSRYEGMVYSLQVQEDESYQTGVMWSHNCCFAHDRGALPGQHPLTSPLQG